MRIVFLMVLCFCWSNLWAQKSKVSTAGAVSSDSKEQLTKLKADYKHLAERSKVFEHLLRKNGIKHPFIRTINSKPSSSAELHGSKYGIDWGKNSDGAFVSINFKEYSKNSDKADAYMDDALIQIIPSWDGAGQALRLLTKNLKKRVLLQYNHYEVDIEAVKDNPDKTVYIYFNRKYGW